MASLNQQVTPLDAAREEVRRLRELCSEAYYMLDRVHDPLSCHACDDAKMGVSGEPCPVSEMVQRLRMAGSWSPPK